ncbi:MAG: hypothetical protein JSS46_01255 [Proteobacteria bacterium]|jgi:type IV pilus assembly protein PilY1|nr:hypothetical protein [Pseudomonadota bacterium]
MRHLRRYAHLAITAALAATVAGPVAATNVDISQTPLVTGATTPVPPNIFFILDDSSSMSWEYVPDSVSTSAGTPCFEYAGYNAMYYDPTVTYTPPIQSVNTDGSLNYFPNSPFNNAKRDGFCTGGSNCNNGTINLALAANQNPQFQAYVQGSGGSYPFITASSDTKQQPYYYTYSGSNPGTCDKSPATKKGPAYGYYTKVIVLPTSPEAQNFANWYTYYRTRISMVKSSAGAAFGALTDKYRVGFTVLSQPGMPVNDPDFLQINAFNATQKQTFFTDLYAAGCPQGCGTPTRGALAKAGRYFAGQFNSNSIADPVIYSCQQNFAVIVTDGYWNRGSPETNSCSKSNAYGPCTATVTPTNVGDQDKKPPQVAPYGEDPKNPNSDSLADVAMYYYNTDLRPTDGSIKWPGYPLGGQPPTGSPTDVTSNNVPTAGADTATWQHMNTYGIALGVPGVLGYASNYLQGGSPDYNKILQGTEQWPDPQTTSNAQSVPARIDDLWHAAVNGRGQYLSVKTPDAVTSALGTALSSISKINGSGAAAATSNLEPVAGDNYAYVPQYTTKLWTGDLQARSIDLTTGAVSATAIWSAAANLQSMVSATTDTRTIYTFSPSGTNNLRTFDASNLTAEIAAGDFQPSITSSPANPTGSLSQYSSWTPTQIGNATSAAMIGYLRGESGNEIATPVTANSLYRAREAVLGDIVDAKPVYVRVPPFKYTDPGYAAFYTAQKTRAGTVYVGANDGMLHAFNATTGVESWAYVPSAVIPQLYKLADENYSTNHQFYADGSLVSGDAYNGSAWKTILVGGLGAGGRGYYALDITNPASPVALWEFGVSQEPNMGYSFGNPVLTKRASDGKWVVIVASGYNNVSPGDGKARLYVLDAFTGAELQVIPVNPTVTDPNANGIAKIANWVDSTLVDNTTQYVYGGDLSGNVWRFDLTAGTAQRLGETSLVAGNQPITVKPELGLVSDATGTSYRVVYFGTGRYMGFSDLASTAPSSSVVQTIYAVKDTGTDLGTLQSAGASLVAQTLDTSTSPRAMATPAASVNWATQNGWYVNLPAGERVDVDPALQLGTFVVASNIPDDTYCKIGGTSWLYALDYATGGPVSTAAAGGPGGAELVVGTFMGNALTVGLNLIRLPGGKVVALVSGSDATVKSVSVPLSPSASASPHRVGWREIN